MRVIIKKPGKTSNVKEINSTEAIYNIVSPNDYPDFVTFDEENQIGMYIEDSGRVLGRGKNFAFKNHIIYGTVAFVGLTKDGFAKDLSVKQLEIVREYLDKKSLR